MTILDKIIELLSLHGVDGKAYDRIDIALDKLYSIEKEELAKKAAPALKEETRRRNRKESIEEI